MSEILSNIYDRPMAFVLGTVSFCGNLLFDEKHFKILYLCFLFIQKIAELVLEKCLELKTSLS